MKTAEESLGIDSDTYNKIVDECLFVEQKPADKVEPKFHEGEWITNGDYTWKIVEVKPLDYILQSQDGNIVDDTISYVDEQFHSFIVEKKELKKIEPKKLDADKVIEWLKNNGWCTVGGPKVDRAQINKFKKDFGLC
jgi:hypothetical protein